MKGFLPEQSVKNRNNDTPWKKSERDQMIDTYLAGGNGAHPNTIAREIGRNPKSVKRRLEEYTYNEDNCIVRYVPFRRRSRKGSRLTQNELAIIKAHKKKDVPPQETAKFLCRDVEEITGSSMTEVAKTKQLTQVAPTLDLIWAYRYIHFVYKQHLITDKAYDTLVEEEIEFGGGEKAFAKIKLHKGWPPHIRFLASYLVEKQKDKQNE